MPHIPNIKHLKKKELLSEERFFRLLSEQNNYVDPKTCNDFYMGLVRLIADELRKNKFIWLPAIGEYALVQQKSRFGWVGKERIVISGMEILKFYPDMKLRKYFNKRQQFSGIL